MLDLTEEASGADTNDDQGNDLTQDQSASLEQALTFANLAKQLKTKDPDQLAKIGEDVVTGYENDETSRSDWMKRNQEYMKLATQVMERKSFPWDNAANVKFPLLTTAALQFASRAYPSLIPSLDIVKAKVIGQDDTGQMTTIANKLSTHMSYKLLYEIEDWEENMDKLCYILPIVGSMFKKVYYTDSEQEICIDLYSPKDVCVNYYTKKLCDSPRITEIQWFTANEIKEKQNLEEWIEWEADFKQGTGDDITTSQNQTWGQQPPSPDEETPRKILIQYCRVDLDEDGYKEPYMITVDYETKKVLRMTANYFPEGVRYKDATRTKVACIEPAEWFVKYDFLPNPDGGFYGMGFGILLGGLNDMVNTITNQLIDAGTLSNLQAGFIGRGLRDSKQKRMSFTPGEWKWVNNPGKDLKENIFPLPVREPSSTMFQLLGTLVQSGKEVASVAEIFTGKMPGQNTPASTTMATIEQGLKVFTSIYKRIYRAMGKEFELLFNLLKKYESTDPIYVQANVNGQQSYASVSRFDYQKASSDIHIIPAADPNMVSETQKLVRIQGLYELMQYQTINAQEMTRQALVYQGQDNIDKLMTMPPPQPPLEIQLKQMDLQDAEKDRQLEMMKISSENQKRQSEYILNIAKARQLGDEQGAAMLEMQFEREKQAMDLHTCR
jgi:chaperonin GroES